MRLKRESAMHWIAIGSVLADSAGTIFLALMLIAGAIFAYDSFWGE